MTRSTIYTGSWAVANGLAGSSGTQKAQIGGFVIRLRKRYLNGLSEMGTESEGISDPSEVSSKGIMAGEALDNQVARRHIPGASVSLVLQSLQGLLNTLLSNVVMVGRMDTTYGFNNVDLPHQGRSG